MDMKKVLLISLIAVTIVASVGAVSAGWFDGLFGGGEVQDKVIEIDHIAFNTTNITKFVLHNECEDEDGYIKWFMDENKTGYNVHIYNFSYIDDMTWGELIKEYKEYQLDNSPSQTINGIVVYTTTANGGNNVGEPRYISYVQNNDLKTIVDFGSPNPNETAKMASTLKFK